VFAAVALAVGLPAFLVPAHASTPTAAAAPNPLPWLHIAHPGLGARPYLADAAGRTVVLRGVNAAGIEDDYYVGATLTSTAPVWKIDPTVYDSGACPTNSHLSGEPPLCQADFAQMHALGFNVVRLTVSWSQLEPDPGEYNQTYIARIAQIVSWAKAEGIYVLIDMHEDDYSRFTPSTAGPIPPNPIAGPVGQSPNHADGAPPWAVLTDGEPAAAVANQGPFNAFVEAAFTSFWLNRIPTDPHGSARPQMQAPGPGLQDHYIGAMAAVARQFVDEPAVVGYEIMNEPLPGLLPPGAFSTTNLYPFYRRVIDALTGLSDGLPCPTSLPATPACGYPDLKVHDTRHAFFFEPMVLRNLEDAPDQAPLPFSSYPNLVYAPHTYTHVFTLDQNAGLSPSASPYPLSYDQAFQVADTEARALGAALFSGEYGTSPDQDNTVLGPEMAAQDRALAGSTLWLWKGNCGPGSTQAQCNNIWGMYAADAAATPAANLDLIPTRVANVSRVWPRATAGTLESFLFDPSSQTFHMTATSGEAVARGDQGHETVVFIPSWVHGTVVVTGGAMLDTVSSQPDLTRVAYIAPDGTGSYAVSVR